MSEHRSLSLYGATKVTFPTRDAFRVVATLSTAEEWQEYFDSWIEIAEQRGYARAMAAPDSPEVVDALVKHQRKDITGCICGWARLGHSHSAHQLAEIVVIVRATQTPGETQ